MTKTWPRAVTAACIWRVEFCKNEGLSAAQMAGHWPGFTAGGGDRADRVLRHLRSHPVPGAGGKSRGTDPLPGGTDRGALDSCSGLAESAGARKPRCRGPDAALASRCALRSGFDPLAISGRKSGGERYGELAVAGAAVVRADRRPQEYGNHGAARGQRSRFWHADAAHHADSGRQQTLAALL